MCRIEFKSIVFCVFSWHVVYQRRRSMGRRPPSFPLLPSIPKVLPLTFTSVPSLLLCLLLFSFFASFSLKPYPSVVEQQHSLTFLALKHSLQMSVDPNGSMTSTSGRVACLTSEGRSFSSSMRPLAFRVYYCWDRL